MRALVVILGLCAACGSSQPPAGPIGNAAPDAGPRELPPLDESCPEAYPVGTGACDGTVADRNCQYDEGQCYCGVAQTCSGVEIDPEEIRRQPTSWQCTPWPPAVRADGCPGTAGGACTNETFECSYGDCCVSSYRCLDGEWTQVRSICPP